MSQDRQTILLRVGDIIRDALDEPDLAIEPDTVARDVPGWDSIAMVNIILRTQQEFGIRFRTTEIDQLVNVGDFVDRIAEKTRNAP